MHATLVHVRVKPEHLAEFIAATRLNAAASRGEPGNRRFDMLQDPADPQRFVLYEVYVTPADAAAHKNTPHYLRWRDTVASFMAGPRRGENMTWIDP